MDDVDLVSRLGGMGGVERREESDTAVVGVSDLSYWLCDLWERPILLLQYLHSQFDGSRDGSVSSQAACGANSPGDLNCLT